MTRRSLFIGWSLALPAVFSVAMLVQVYFGGFAKLATDSVAMVRGLAFPPEEIVAAFSYPASGVELIAGPENCDLICMASRAQPGQAAIYLGTGETGYFYSAAPPGPCLFLSLRFPTETIRGISAAPAAIVFDGAPQAALQGCNPETPIPDYDFGIRVPAWFRTEHAAVISVPQEIFRRNLNYIVHVCALSEDGRVLEFFGDNSRSVLLPSNDGKCGPDDVTRPTA
jgi:hypothetical protein